MNKDISLGLKVEQQNPIFLKHNISSYGGDYKVLTFKISFKYELFFVECQIKEFNTAIFHSYIIIKDFETMHIKHCKSYSLNTEDDAVFKICKFLDKVFP